MRHLSQAIVSLSLLFAIGHPVAAQCGQEVCRSEWEGFYIGALIGYDWSHMTQEGYDISQNNQNQNNNTIGTFNYEGNEIKLGGYFGRNYISSTGGLRGWELGISTGGYTAWDEVNSNAPPGTIDDYQNNYELSLSLSGRVGCFLSDDTLLYVTAGPTYTLSDLEWRLNARTEDYNHHLLGGMIGAGIEKKVGRGRIRLEGRVTGYLNNTWETSPSIWPDLRYEDRDTIRSQVQISWIIPFGKQRCRTKCSTP